MRVYLASLLCMVVVASVAVGQQVSFKAKAVGNQVAFSYTWRDADKQSQTLSFSLPAEDLSRGRNEFRPFDNAALNNHAYAAVTEYAQTNSNGDVQLKVKRSPGGFNVEADGPANAPLEEYLDAMRLTRDLAVEDYMALNFYTKVDDGHIMPDHKRIAQRYAPALAPVQAAIRRATEGKSQREVINYILGFLQSIPYDTLNSRTTANGAGYQTPYGLLADNKGDCDTKSVTLAALLRGLYPQVRLTMVYVPEHAFIGIALPRDTQDYALKLDGTAFVLADPTGPKQLKLGEADESALRNIQRRRYSYQEIMY